jgi:hypothetical protein
MYIQNETDVPIFYTVVGGVVVHGTILPGRGAEVESPSAINLSFSTDDGSPLPADLTVRLSS